MWPKLFGVFHRLRTILRFVTDEAVGLEQRAQLASECLVVINQQNPLCTGTDTAVLRCRLILRSGSVRIVRMVPCNSTIVWLTRNRRLSVRVGRMY